ncbi:MAG: DUF2834 domain-containing protein [Prochloraceae cyanobacterium]
MYRKIGFGLLWASFVIYAFVFAPPQQPDTIELIKNMSTGEWEGINPLIIALFNIMGILPMMYGCFLFSDGRGQKILAWPFASGSFFFGAFALLPYLALREPNPNFIGEKNWFIKVWDSRIAAIFITIGAIYLLAFGFLNGDWTDFFQQWQTSRFIHVMSLDFCLLCLLFPALLGDDFAKRGIEENSWLRRISFIPFFGILAYLCLRPSLPESGLEKNKNEEPTDKNLIAR